MYGLGMNFKNKKYCGVTVRKHFGILEIFEGVVQYVHRIEKDFYGRVFYADDGDQEDVIVSELETLRWEIGQENFQKQSQTSADEQILLLGANVETKNVVIPVFTSFKQNVVEFENV